MTHYALLVTKVTEYDIDKVMSPFSEDNLVDPYILKTAGQLLELAKDNFYNNKKFYMQHLINDKKQWVYVEDFLKNKLDHNFEPTDEEIYEIYVRPYVNNGGDARSWIDGDGNLVSRYNPNAKYDWYTIGGRWANYFPMKGSDAFYSTIRIKDIDWEKMDDITRQERAVEFKQFVANPNGHMDILSNGYHKGMTEEEFVDLPISHAPFAILHEGNWYERGEVRWYGQSSDNVSAEDWDKQFKHIINSLSPEDVVAIVDCHI